MAIGNSAQNPDGVGNQVQCSPDPDGQMISTLFAAGKSRRIHNALASLSWHHKQVLAHAYVQSPGLFDDLCNGSTGKDGARPKLTIDLKNVKRWGSFIGS